MPKVYLSIGSNLGEKEKQLNTAIHLINERAGTVISTSSYYATEPWKMTTDHEFLNAAVCINTNLTPYSLLQTLQKIEKDMGRHEKTHQKKYEDRIIDIDMLLYDGVKVDTFELTLPHPLMSERAFVLKPLSEIHPQFTDHIKQIN